MAVIWQKRVEGKQYEVRGAGRTRRLYTDGVFHSQYNPGRSLTGNVWDLLSLPSFFLEATQLRRALVLGVGGGTVIRQLRRWYPHVEVTGIELNPTHLYIARRFFDLDDPAVTLIEADAIEWMQCYADAPFDLIVDDLFFEEDGEPCRAVSADRQWLRTLTAALSAHGMLSMNFISSRDLRDSAVFHNRSLQSRFKNAYRFMTPLYENNIGVFLSRPQTLNQWQQRIADQAPLQAEFAEKRGKYQIRKLKY
ncbi:MAG: methyltransferase domain-containing protein [Gammaproteobacteria bacterium]|nr:methyltransferase domain-containing protein [Gammaproteobacteria bacterium]